MRPFPPGGSVVRALHRGRFRLAEPSRQPAVRARYLRQGTLPPCLLLRGWKKSYSERASGRSFCATCYTTFFEPLVAISGVAQPSACKIADPKSQGYRLKPVYLRPRLEIISAPRMTRAASQGPPSYLPPIQARGLLPQGCSVFFTG